MTTQLQRNVKALIEKSGGMVGAAKKLGVTTVSLQTFMLGVEGYAKTRHRIGFCGKGGVILKTSSIPMPEKEEKAPKAKRKAKKMKVKGPAKKTKVKAAPKAKAPKKKKAARKTKPKASKEAMNGVPTSAPKVESPSEDVAEAP